MTRLYDTTSRFPQNARIRIAVTNANPFVYEYRIRANAQEIVQPSIADFFKIGLGITLPTSPMRGAADLSTPTAMRKYLADVMGLTITPERQQPEHCAGPAAAVAKRLQSRLRDANTSASDIRHTFEGFSTWATVKDKAFGDHRRAYLDEAKNAVEVHSGAIAADQDLVEFSNMLDSVLAGVTPKVESFNRSLGDLSEQARADVLRSFECHDVVAAAVAIDALVPDTSLFRANLAAIAAKGKDITTARRALETVMNDPSRYYAANLLQHFDNPTDVTVTISRRSAASTDSFVSLGSGRFHVGGDARFALAAGLVWSSIGRKAYTVSRTFTTPSPGNPGDTTIATVVETENSTWRVFPVITFNMRFAAAPYAPQPFIGAGISNVSSDPRPGFLAGVAFEIQKDFMLSVGGIAGSEDYLTSGLRPGDRLPGSATSVPVQSRWRVGGTIGLTYRVF